MPKTLRCSEETDHCKSETERGIKEVVKEILRDKPREEGAGDDQNRQHQSEDHFGFIIVPNPPQCEFSTTGGGKIKDFFLCHCVNYRGSLARLTLCDCKGTTIFGHMQDFIKNNRMNEVNKEINLRFFRLQVIGLHRRCRFPSTWSFLPPSTREQQTGSPSPAKTSSLRWSAIRLTDT